MQKKVGKIIHLISFVIVLFAMLGVLILFKRIAKTVKKKALQKEQNIQNICYCNAHFSKAKADFFALMDKDDYVTYSEWNAFMDAHAQDIEVAKRLRAELSAAHK